MVSQNACCADIISLLIVLECLLTFFLDVDISKINLQTMETEREKALETYHDYCLLS